MRSNAKRAGSVAVVVETLEGRQMFSADLGAVSDRAGVEAVAYRLIGPLPAEEYAASRSSAAKVKSTVPVVVPTEPAPKQIQFWSHSTSQERTGGWLRSSSKLLD